MHFLLYSTESEACLETGMNSAGDLQGKRCPLGRSSQQLALSHAGPAPQTRIGARSVSWAALFDAVLSESGNCCSGQQGRRAVLSESLKSLQCPPPPMCALSLVCVCHISVAVVGVGGPGFTISGGICCTGGSGCEVNVRVCVRPADPGNGVPAEG